MAVMTRVRALADRRRRPALLTPAGLTQAQAQALRVPAECPPALLAVLVDIARRVAADAAGQGDPQTAMTKEDL